MNKRSVPIIVPLPSVCSAVYGLGFSAIQTLVVWLKFYLLKLYYHFVSHVVSEANL